MDQGISETAKTEIRRLMSLFPQRQSALLGALFVAQEEVGYLSPAAVEDVAAVMDLAVSEVTSVASFYHLFRFKPEGRHLIQVCTNIACLLNGCGKVLDRVRRQLAIDVGETTPDGAFTLKTAECLAACDQAPMMMVGPDIHGPLTPDKVDEILSQYASSVGGQGSGVGGQRSGVRSSTPDPRHPTP